MHVYAARGDDPGTDGLRQKPLPETLKNANQAEALLQQHTRTPQAAQKLADANEAHATLSPDKVCVLAANFVHVLTTPWLPGISNAADSRNSLPCLNSHSTYCSMIDPKHMKDQGWGLWGSRACTTHNICMVFCQVKSQVLPVPQHFAFDHACDIAGPSANQ